MGENIKALTYLLASFTGVLLASVTFLLAIRLWFRKVLMVRFMEDRRCPVCGKELSREDIEAIAKKNP